MAGRLLRSVAFRLALGYLALFGGSVLVLLAFIYWSTAAYMARQAEATIEAEVSGLADRYRLDGLAGLTELIGSRLSRKPAGSGIYLLTDWERGPLLGNLNRWPVDARRQGDWLEFPLSGFGQDQQAVHRARARIFRLSGGFRLLVGRDMHDLDAAKQRIVRTLAWGVVIMLVLGWVGGMFLSRGMMGRIETINAAVREIMSGDLSRRLPGRGSGDDFDELIGSLNRMLARIESLMESVHRVSDNIAHDLRTPLARLRNRLEWLRMHAGGDCPDREAIDQAVAEADRLLATFNALLRIARVETGDSQESWRRVDMAGLVQDVTELYEPLADEQEQRIELHLAPDASTCGDRDLIFQAVANLLDNAIKYTPKGGRIELRLTTAATGGSSQLAVGDSGPGIPAALREKVFQRFFRLESSRTTPGNGLGLSLVAAVVTRHRMSIRLEDNHPGLRVLIGFSNIGSDECSGDTAPGRPAGGERSEAGALDSHS